MIEIVSSVYQPGRSLGGTCLLAVCLTTVPPAVVADEIDPNAIYGEVGILLSQEGAGLKTGHELLQPLTDAISGYYAFKDRLREQYGLAYTIEYSPQFQWDMRFDGVNTANDETNLIFQWAPIDPSNTKRGSLIGWYQISRTLGSRTTSQFMNDIGVITPVNGGDTAPGDFRDLWQMLAWEQWILDERLRISIGKLTTRTFLNLNRYAVSDREDFFTPQLVNNTVVPFTARNGMGMFAQFFMDQAYLTGMIREADGTSEDISFSTLDSGRWEYALELGLTPDNLAGLGEGMYRFTSYYTDSIGEGAAREPAGWAFATSFDQDIGEGYGALFRYSYGTRDWRAFKQRLSLGMQIKRPLGYQFDRIGVGGWWAEPTASDLNSESGLEAFWKLQLAPYLEVTSDLQLILDPQGGTSRDTAVIGGIRLTVLL